MEGARKLRSGCIVAAGGPLTMNRNFLPPGSENTWDDLCFVPSENHQSTTSGERTGPHFKENMNDASQSE
jgi:hypothetical protein